MSDQKPRPVSIETPRLILRTPILKDGPSYHFRVTDKVTNYYLPWLKYRVHSVQTCEDAVRRWQSSSMVKDAILSIVLKKEEEEEGECIGEGGVQKFDLEKKEGEIGIALNNESHVLGKGYAVEAMKATIDWAFAKPEPSDDDPDGLLKGLGLEKLHIGTLAANEPLRGLVEKKLGLSGTEKNGSLGPEMVYWFTKDEWAANHKGG